MKHFREEDLPSSGVRPTQAVAAGTAPAPRTAQRSSYWDNVKFALILLVVLGHLLLSREDLKPVTLATLAIYTFHMPAFAFVSGYFSKSERSRSFEKMARLLVAYVVFNGVFMLYAAYCGSDVLVTYPYYSFWYIIALVVWRLTVGWVARFGIWGLLATVATSLLMGFAKDAGNAFAFGRIVAFYPFFLAGFLMPKKWGEYLEQRGPIFKVVVGGVLVAASAAALWYSYRWLHFDYADVLMDPYDRMLDVRARAVILALAVLLTVAVLISTPNGKIPVLTMIGKNSLSVYLLHRYFVLLYERLYAPSADATMLLATSGGLTLVLLLLLGNDLVNNLMGGFLDRASSLVTGSESKGFLSLASKAILVLFAAATAFAPAYAMRRPAAGASSDYVPSYTRLTPEEETALNDAYTVLFAGDLTLLEDQVRLGYTGKGYDFSPVFEYTKPYIEKADLAIGVFEGVCAGKEAGYSSGNFDDTKPLWMNFPDEFAAAVADAGFDVVTTADNHLLDRGVDGAYRTLDVLEEAGITPVGTYRSQAEKDEHKVRVVEMGDLKLALLAYTYGVNDGDADYPEDAFLGGELSSVTNILVDPASSNFGAVREQVLDDLDAARALGCDLVVVLPHWGTQFSHEVDEYQEAWREVFLMGGADIILGAHSHATQPIEFAERNGRQTVTVFCPGNYCDVYLDQDVDASALVEVRIDRTTKQPIGCSIIPQWCVGSATDNYRGLPVYDILYNDSLASEISSQDMARVEEVHKLVTSTMLGTSLGLGQARERLFVTPAGFARSSVAQLKLTEDEAATPMAKLLSSAGSVCFVGDNITAGGENGGYGWYEPLESLVGGKVQRVAVNGATSKTLLDEVSHMADAAADLYVVAIGANDVRYRDEATCAMTAEDYVANLGELTSQLSAIAPDARFVFVAPWTSTAGDLGSPLYVDEKRELLAEYAEALKAFCEEAGYDYVDPNPAIEAVIDTYPQGDYLVDAFHPNSTRGIELYSRSFLGIQKAGEKDAA